MEVRPDSLAKWLDFSKWTEAIWKALVNSFGKFIYFINNIDPVFKLIGSLLFLIILGLVIWGVWKNRYEWQRCKNF